MFILKNLGEHSMHGGDFAIHRPGGTPHALILFVHTPADFYYNGSWQRVAPGTAFVFHPGQPQQYRAVGSSYQDSWMWAEIPPSLLQEDFPFGQPIPLHHLERYEALLHLMCDEFYSASPQREEIVHHMGLSLIHMLARETQTAPRPALYYALIRIRREIYKNPEKDWSIPNIAAAAAISPSYLQKNYQRFFGITCNRDVIQSRIEAACSLLDATTMPVEEVGQACGYRNVEHFIRQFKSVTGVTPGQYRKNKRTSLSETPQS